MRFYYFVLIFASLFLISCQSAELSRSPHFSQSILNNDLTLEAVITNWSESLDKVNPRTPSSKTNWQEDLHKICLKQDDLCELPIKSSKKSKSLNKKLISEINHDLNEGNFSNLENYNIEIGLQFFSRLKKNKLMGWSHKLIHETECKSRDLRHALASTLEDELPDLEVKNTVQALYEKNSECPSSRTSTLSSYRAAMFRLVDQDCSKALPLLDKVSISTEDYLKPRSQYWTWRCQSAAPEKKPKSNSLDIPYFSYHRLMIEETPSDTTNAPTSLIEKTPILIESNQNAHLNETARLVEKLIVSEQLLAARAVLQKIRVQKVQEAEPEFQIYWARLLHITNMGIKNFQILSSLVNNYPQFRTKAVKKMLFPNSYFEFVEATSKTIDPWLVQSLIRQESAFDPAAKSRVGATGLMQIMPATARKISKVRGQLKDPIYNVQAGVKFLEMLVNRFDGQVHLALAAYNAGPGKVQNWQKRYPTNDPMLFVDTIPYRETREYVAFILRNYYWYRSLNPEQEMSQTEIQSDLVRMATQIESY